MLHLPFSHQPRLHLIVGHRGVGKTAFLQRVRAAYARRSLPVTTWDLDAELSRHHGVAVATLFHQHGEPRFREHEHALLRARLADLCDPSSARDLSDVYVALGAGYDEDPRAAVPPAWLPLARVLWLRRLTDPQGRIFVDSARPRLDPDLPPLTEFQRRFVERQSRYQAWHDIVWIMPEGAESDENPAEDQFIFAALASHHHSPKGMLPAVLTLLPESLARSEAAHEFLMRRLTWPGLRFELRDDLLSDAQRAWAQRLLPPERVIRSARRALPSHSDVQAACRQKSAVDLPCELLQSPPAERWLREWTDWLDGAMQPGLIASLHDRGIGESVPQAAARLQGLAQQLGAQHAKLAIEVHDFAELASGLAWASEDPLRRAFLPRTPTAQHASGPERFRWFRALQALARRSPLSFVREGDGSSADQPTLCEHLQLGMGDMEQPSPSFAAVLGDPVQHSRSPSEHRAFFSRQGLPMFAIPCSEADIAHGGLELLRQLGLRCAAVTAPLKRAVGALTGLASCNTLWWQDDTASWQGGNTDPVGLRALLASLPADAQVAVWGGGGVLPSIQETLPQAQFFSLRTAGLRSPSSCASDASDGATPNVAALAQPSVVVWAAGHRGRDAALQPPASWRPQCVYDLDYREDSAARDYALRVGARYVSGLLMFTAQAAAQRAIWQHCLTPATPSPAKGAHPAQSHTIRSTCERGLT